MLATASSQVIISAKSKEVQIDNHCCSFATNICLGKQWWTCNDETVTQTEFDRLNRKGYLYLFKQIK